MPGEVACGDRRQKKLSADWCSGRDSNPQGSLHMHLKHACLPISPPEQATETARSISYWTDERKGASGAAYGQRIKSRFFPFGAPESFLMRWKCLSNQQPAAQQPIRVVVARQAHRCPPPGTPHRTRPTVFLCVGIEPTLRWFCPAFGVASLRSVSAASVQQFSVQWEADGSPLPTGHWLLAAGTLPTHQKFVLPRVSGEKEFLMRWPYRRGGLCGRRSSTRRGSSAPAREGCARQDAGTPRAPRVSRCPPSRTAGGSP